MKGEERESRDGGGPTLDLSLESHRRTDPETPELKCTPERAPETINEKGRRRITGNGRLPQDRREEGAED